MRGGDDMDIIDAKDINWEDVFLYQTFIFYM